MKSKWYFPLVTGLALLLISSVLLPACAVPASPTTTEAPAPQADIRLAISMDTVYYGVSGETTEEIFNSVKANGPVNEAMTTSRFTTGLTEANASYEYKFLDHGSYCKLQSVDINMRLVVTLPRHSTPQALGDLQLSQWNEYADTVAIHEQKHVDIHNDGMEAFKKELESLPEKFSDCGSLESSLASAWESRWTLDEQEQDAFHLAEEQQSRLLRKPVQMQIDQNKTEFDQLQYKADLLSLEIDALTLKVDEIKLSTQPYKAQMDVIQNQYPDLVLPSGAYDEYQRLRVEWYRLTGLRNQVVADVNALVQQYKQTTEELNRLTEQINQLIDELNWIP